MNKCWQTPQSTNLAPRPTIGCCTVATATWRTSQHDPSITVSVNTDGLLEIIQPFSHNVAMVMDSALTAHASAPPRRLTRIESDPGFESRFQEYFGSDPAIRLSAVQLWIHCGHAACWLGVSHYAKCRENRPVAV